MSRFKTGISGIAVLLLSSTVIIYMRWENEYVKDSLNFSYWTRNSTLTERQMSDTIQRFLEKIQNPLDCAKAKKLVCRLYKKAGMISDIHLLLYCFHVGIMMNRTVVFDSKQWSYTTNGWKDVFEPPSKTCVIFQRAVFWPGNNDSMVIRQAWLPAETKCIQVRRTDKAREADPTPVAKYFEKIDEFYAARNIIDYRDRIVYLATDEITVWKDIREQFPSYKVFGDVDSTRMANVYNTRNNVVSDRQLIADLFVLSKSDFIVCTLSSNICRLIYEILMSSGIAESDMSKHLVSVNGAWHYHGTY